VKLDQNLITDLSNAINRIYDRILNEDFSDRLSEIDPEAEPETAALTGAINRILAILEHKALDRKQVEQNLQERETFLRLVLENIPQGIFWKDKNSVYLGCNRTLALMAGIEDVKNIIGKVDQELPWEQEEAQSFQADDNKVMNSDRPRYHIIETVQRADGQSAWIDTSKIPLHDTNGNVIGVLGTFEDITDRKRTEIELQESEARFRTLAEATFEGVMIHSQGKIIDANQNLADMSGYQLDELIGMDMLQLVTPESRHLVVENVQVDNEMLYEIEALRKNGSKFSVEIRGKHLPYQGKAMRVAAIRDISDRKQAEAELEKAYEYLNSVIDNLGVGLLVIDQHDRVNRINPALENMFRLEDVDVSEIIGNDCEQVFGSELKHIVAQTQSCTEIFTAELPLSDRKVGMVVGSSIHGSVLGDPNRSNCIGTVLLVRDITLEKEVDRMKTEFISNISHELRTPLTSILGFAKMICKKLESVDTLNPIEPKKLQRTLNQAGDNLGIIITEGERLSSIVNSVIDIANIEAGKTSWQMQPLSISEIITAAIEHNAAAIDRKQMHIQVDLEPDLPMILGDRDRLIQVVSNLISNAVKFSPDTSEINCQVQLNTQSIVVSISDSGMGIDKADRAKVFEKFSQIGDPLTAKPQGTGLGLSISKRVIEHHKGKIWVESELDKGSKFSFSLPLNLDLTNGGFDTPKTNI